MRDHPVCATADEWHFWAFGNHAEDDPHYLDSAFNKGHVTFCNDGDDVGCGLLRDAGRCPFTAKQYLGIQHRRDRLNAKVNAWMQPDATAERIRLMDAKECLRAE